MKSIQFGHASKLEISNHSLSDTTSLSNSWTDDKAFEENHLCEDTELDVTDD
jgi:hypothetical protein